MDNLIKEMKIKLVEMIFFTLLAIGLLIYSIIIFDWTFFAWAGTIVNIIGSILGIWITITTIKLIIKANRYEQKQQGR